VVLAKAQRCDPAGVFARSLAECLRLQLAARDRLDATMVALLDNLDLLAARELSRLATLCEVDDEELVLMVHELRELDPKPGLAFAAETAQTIVADVLVSRRADGGWAVELNAETLPRVLVNNRYYAEVSRHARAKQDRAYLGENLQSANWLVKALDQRANTILKVTGEIVRRQQGFLLHGVRHLRPLTLRDVAEAVEMHESTVSRVTSHKYMATHRGIFELKYFFTSAIPGRAGGEAVSSEAVRDHIRSLIDKETANAVLSDDRLVTLLRGSGIDIARRTVAKYRESMKIPSSVQRRRLKRASL
jgi:RNA polymerase sigma-54 factor